MDDASGPPCCVSIDDSFLTSLLLDKELVWPMDGVCDLIKIQKHKQSGQIRLGRDQGRVY